LSDLTAYQDLPRDKPKTQFQLRPEVRGDRSNPMFKAIDVWKRISDSAAVRYRCFQCLQTGKYSVQSADFYRLPGNPNESAQLERQHIELFIEQAPDGRSEAYETLEAAIEAHEAEFDPPT
jgi:hypothetical protein